MSIEKIKNQLLLGDKNGLKSFNLLTNDEKIEVLNAATYDLHQLEDAVLLEETVPSDDTPTLSAFLLSPRCSLRAMAEKKKIILSIVKEISIGRLDLSFYGEVVTDSDLLNILKNTGALLVELDLSDCLQLTNKSINTIAKHCPNLEILRLTNISREHIDSSWFKSGMDAQRFISFLGHFPALTDLDLSYCHYLRELSFSAPKLQQLTIEGCPQLHAVAEFYFKSGETKYEQDQYKEAIHDLNVSLAIEPGNLLARCYRGHAHLELRHLEEAIIDFDAVLEKNPEDMFALQYRITAKYRLGRYLEAIADIDAALVKEPGNVNLLVGRGDNKRMLGLHSEALADFDAVLIEEPGNALALGHRGEVKRMLGHYLEAMVDFDAALAEEPKNSFALGCRGEVKRVLGRYLEAITDFNAALTTAVYPENVDILNGRGIVKMDLDLYSEAIADFDEAIAIEPVNVFTLEYRGIAKMNLDLYSEAIEDFNAALAEKPENAIALTYRGAAKCMLGRYLEAIADIDAALAKEPGDIFSLSHRGKAKYFLGKYEEAIIDFDATLAVDPDDSLSLDLKEKSQEVLRSIAAHAITATSSRSEVVYDPGFFCAFTVDADSGTGDIDNALTSENNLPKHPSL